MSPDHNAGKIETSSQNISLKKEIQKFNNVFSEDLELVRKTAEEHHIQLIKGSITDKAKNNAYNLLLPYDRDVESLKKAKTILVECMDRRQVKQVQQIERPNITIAMAGGPAQPDETRRNALIHFLSEIGQVNDNCTFILYAHDSICGGANYFTQGEAQKQNARGQREEHIFMSNFTKQVVDGLETHGVQKNRIHTGIATIKNNSFDTIVRN
jgi:hypothetical protein